MVITASYPAQPLKQRFRTPSLVIIEFVLGALPQIGTAGQLLYLSLIQNYIHTPERLCHKQIPYDIGGTEALEAHTTQIVKIVKELQKGYVVLML